MRSRALRSGPCGSVSFWEESPWFLKHKRGSENRCRVNRATSPTCSCHLVASRGSALQGPSQVEEAALTPHGFSFASGSHPDQKPSKVFMVLEQTDPCPAGFTRLFPCPATLQTVTPRHLATVLCWGNVGKGTL